MKTLETQTQTIASRIARHLRKFQTREDGTMVIFAVFMLILMLLVTGMAVDFMRIESTRTRMQGTLDRAVLAAADLGQTLPREQVVQDYMVKAGLGDALQGTPTVTEGLNFREVSAVAQATVPMMFSGLAKILDADATVHESMTVPASSVAEERVSKVEISLVLDISGSMESNNRMTNLHTAATEFVNTVLKDGNEDLVSVSLIPYSEHVNPGPDLFNLLNVRKVHNYSHCIEFDNDEFTSTSLSLTERYDQMQYFQWNYNGSYRYGNDLSETVCPRWDYERINAWESSRTELVTQINQLRGRAGTSIFLGLKWGAALLDPSTRPLLTSLVGSNKVDSNFAGRPASYTDTETVKFIILMTDGENSTSSRIQSWAYDSDSDYAHWSRYNFNWYLDNYVSSWKHSQYSYLKYNRTLGNELMDDICDAAKAQGIVIWTIGFEIPDPVGNQVLADCATSPSHFFDVDGIEISHAFSAIATQINNLKLTH